jgi:hypothetical protein
VHSSPNAVDAYERLGFKAVGPEKLENGIYFIPMRIILRMSWIDNKPVELTSLRSKELRRGTAV